MTIWHYTDQTIGGVRWRGEHIVSYDEYGWPAGGTLIEWERVA